MRRRGVRRKEPAAPAGAARATGNGKPAPSATAERAFRSDGLSASPLLLYYVFVHLLIFQTGPSLVGFSFSPLTAVR